MSCAPLRSGSARKCGARSRLHFRRGCASPRPVTRATRARRRSTIASPGCRGQIAGSDVGSDGQLLASCELDNAGVDVVPDGAACGSDGDCRDGTCALGHCTDLCSAVRDCGVLETCAQIPRVEANGAMFGGCLPSTGTIQFTIPVSSPEQTVALPISSTARSVSMVMAIDNPNQASARCR